MEKRKIFLSGSLKPAQGFMPVPVYFEHTGWRLASNGIWSGLQLSGIILIVRVLLMIAPQLAGNGRWLGSIFSQFLPVALAATGFLIVFANGGLDLSMGGVSIFAGSFAAQLITNGTSPAAAVVLCLFLSLTFGLVHGILIGAVRLPGLLVTLVSGVLFRAIALASLEGRTLPVQGDLSGVPVLGWLIFLVMIAAAFLWLQFPAFNARCPSSPSRVREALQTGLPYVFSALAAGIYGLVMTSRIQAAGPFLGDLLEFDNVLVMVLAGVCLCGQYGNVAGVFLGALSLTLIRYMMAVAAINVFHQRLFLGILCLLGSGWMYLYHWITGLIHRNSTRRTAVIPERNGADTQ